MMNDIEGLGMKGMKMPHSHSTPAGVDGGSRTPPATPRRAGKMLAVRVQMLDDSITMFQVQVKKVFFSLFWPNGRFVICFSTVRGERPRVYRIIPGARVTREGHCSLPADRL